MSEPDAPPESQPEPKAEADAAPSSVLADEPAPPSLRAEGLPPKSIRASEPAPRSIRASEPAPKSLPRFLIDRIDPVRGPLAGGTEIKVFGQGFVGEIRGRLGERAVDVDAIEGGLSLVAPPADAAGPTTLRLEDESGRVAELVFAFRYDPPPLFVRVDPDWSSITGRPRATLFGAHFEDDCKVELDGEAIDVVRPDGTRLELAVPAHAAGTISLVVRNADGQRSAPLPFVFIDPPLVEAVDPAEVSVDGGAEVSVRGSAFTEGCAVTFGDDPAAVVRADPNEIVVVAPARVAGGHVDVRVTDAHGLSSTLHVALYYRPKPAPVIDAVEPPRGPSSGGTAVTVRGHDFLDGCRVRIFESDVDVVFVGPDRLEFVTPSVPGGGPVDVVVTNPDAQAVTMPRAFLYETALRPPTLAAISPNRGSKAGGAKLTLLGEDFAPGCKLRLGGAAVDVEFRTNREARAIAPPSAVLGTVDAELENPDGQSARLDGAFTFDDVPAPVITSVSPVSGPTTGGTKVTIEGHDFSDTCSIFVDRERPQAIPKRSKTELVIVMPPRKQAGLVEIEIEVLGAGKTVKKNAFKYEAVPPPIITQVSPNRVGTAGGSELTVIGKNFVKTSVVLVDGRSARSVKFVDASTLEVKTPEGDANKLVDVTVRNPDGREAVQKKAVMFDPRYG